MNQKNTSPKKTTTRESVKKTPFFCFFPGLLGFFRFYSRFFFPKETEIGDLLHGQVVKFRFALPRLDPDSFREVGWGDGKGPLGSGWI